MKRKKENRSLYNNWAQLNFDVSAERFDLVRTNSLAYCILEFLAYHMDSYNAVVCSSKVFEDYFHVGRTSVYEAIKLLKERGFIFVSKSGTSNVYSVNDRVFWKSYGDSVKLSKFPANVILTKSEQFEPLNKLGYDKQIRIDQGGKK